MGVGFFPIAKKANAPKVFTHLAHDASVELLCVVLYVPRERVRVSEPLAALRAHVRQARRRGRRVRARAVPAQLLVAPERAAALGAPACRDMYLVKLSTRDHLPSTLSIVLRPSNA